MRQNGFTLIHMMLILATGLILLSLEFVMTNNYGPLSIGINGLTEVRCIEGYKYTVGEGGQARQMIDSTGKGIQCP